MRHLIKLIAVISLLYLIPAQASFDIATGSECIIFADDSKEDGKKNGDADTEEEEEEPDCD